MSAYTIFVERAESGANWGAWSPDLNVYATGAIQDDAVVAVTSAIGFHLDGLREAGDPIPEASATAVTVQAIA